MFSIAGRIVTSLGILAEIMQQVSDLALWDEDDLTVNQDWLDLAMMQKLIPGPRDAYTWVNEHGLAMLELEGSRSPIVALNGERRIKYRLVQRGATDRLVLTRNLR